MRQFVTGLCCAIVGLEVLVGVPLVTCGVMFALWEGGEVSPVVQVHTAAAPDDFAGPFPCPPPPISFPQPGTPVSIPAPSFPQPDTCPPPATTADAFPPLSPTTEAIAEARRHNGSPLDGTVVAPDSLAPLASAQEFIAKVEQLATEEPAPTVCPPLETTVAACGPLTALNPLPRATTNGVGNQAVPAGQGTPADSLQQAAHALYARALELEIAGDFSRSDKVRRLAREIHGLIDSLAGEVKLPAPASAPGTALAPAPTSAFRAPDLESSLDSSSSSPVLVPAQAELVPATPMPDQPTILPAAKILVIPDEPEALLISPPLTQKPAEKPAP